MSISLTSPAIGSTNWGTSVNLNWTAISNAFSATAPFTGTVTIAPTAVSSGVQTALALTGAANTGLTASTEVNDVLFSINRTVQWATGALTTQRAVFINAPTYAFVGASTITNAATFAISGAPIAGSNASITNSYALWVQGGNCLFAGTMTMANGTFAGTTAINSVNITPTYTGSVTGSAVISALTSSPVFTPGGASTAIYLGAYINPSVSSQANTNPAASALIGMYLTPQFATANTSSVTVLTEIVGVDVGMTVTSTNATGTNTIPNIFGYYEALTANSTGGGGLTITNYYGIYLATPSLTITTITNRYGVFQADAAATNIFSGLSTFGQSSTFSSAASQNVLSVAGSFTGITANTVIGVNVFFSATPPSASTGQIIGVIGAPSISSATNVFAASMLLTGLYAAPSFATQNTTGATVLFSLTGLQVTPSVGGTNASGANTVTNVYGINVQLPAWSITGGGSMVVTNYYGIYLGPPTLSAVTISNRYGVYQADTLAVNKFLGNTLIAGGAADGNISSTSWTTTGSITIAAGVLTTLNSNAATIASFTLKMPASPSQGQMIILLSTGIVTTFTFSPNTSQTIQNPPITLAANSCIRYIFSGTIWYRMQ